MFDGYDLRPGGGVNPPYGPAYPIEWDAKIRTVEVIATCRTDVVDAALASTPFTRVNDRVAFRFMRSVHHALAMHTGGLFDLMVTVAVRYQDLLTHTHLHMYCSDPIGIVAGRELFGYPKKDCSYHYAERLDGRVDSWVERRGRRLASLHFTSDPGADDARLVDGNPPIGEIHVRRVPHPIEPRPIYEDVVYRSMPLAYTEPLPGRVSMNVINDEFDPLGALEPDIIGAHFFKTDTFGGSLADEDRRLLERLT